MDGRDAWRADRRGQAQRAAGGANVSGFEVEGLRLSAAWHGPSPEEAGTVVALTHGASGTLNTPQLRTVCDGLGAAGLAAVRFNLPASEEGKRRPGPARRDQDAWRAVAASLATRARRVVLGGRSYGGRMASHAAADGAPAHALLFLAYPLHPPGKPETLRTSHLPRIQVPMLFVQGTRDAFATRALLEETVASLPHARVHWIEGGDHSHKVARRSPADVAAEIAQAAAAWLRSQI